MGKSTEIVSSMPPSKAAAVPAVIAKAVWVSTGKKNFLASIQQDFWDKQTCLHRGKLMAVTQEWRCGSDEVPC